MKYLPLKNRVSQHINKYNDWILYSSLQGAT